jgi:hypothetical protein
MSGVMCMSVVVRIVYVVHKVLFWYF